MIKESNMTDLGGCVDPRVDGVDLTIGRAVTSLEGSAIREMSGFVPVPSISLGASMILVKEYKEEQAMHYEDNGNIGMVL